MESRITLTPFQKQAEFSVFARLAFNEPVMHMNMGRVFTQEEAEGYFAYVLEYNRAHADSGTYQVFASGAFIGICSLWVRDDGAEIEYMVLPEYWQRGYATEMAACLLERAAQLENVQQVRALVEPQNLSSVRVLVKNGFLLERMMHVDEDNSDVQVFVRAMQHIEGAAVK